MKILKNFAKPTLCFWISRKSWNVLSLKEQHYIILRYVKKFSPSRIMLHLHIIDYSNFWRIQKKVDEKLKSDIAIYNERQKNSLNKEKKD